MVWEQRWQEGKTGWDAGDSAPSLELLVASKTLPKGRALVPGCGSGYDVFTLAESGRFVLGLDLSATAIKRFHKLRKEKGFSLDQVDVSDDDFFHFEPSEPFDLIWDYTFLCAIEPSERENWAKRMEQLLVSGGELITLIFPIREDDKKGPPYAMSLELVSNLLSPYFSQISLKPAEKSHPARAGKEWLGRWRKKE